MKSNKQAIGYVRVSTKEQGSKRNGLEAQIAHIKSYAEDNNYELLSINEEVMSGGLGLTYREVLKDTIERCCKTGATLLVSKLDRLGRDSLLIGKLMKQQGLRVIVAQLGEDADLFTIHIYAALAEKEKLNIGQRTSSALQAVKAKGTLLGNRVNLPQAAEKGRNTQVGYANKFASQIESVLSSFLSVGKSFNSIAQEFNKLGIDTPRGGKWTARSVINCYNRLRLE